MSLLQLDGKLTYSFTYRPRKGTFYYTVQMLTIFMIYACLCVYIIPVQNALLIEGFIPFDFRMWNVFLAYLIFLFFLVY